MKRLSKPFAALGTAWRRNLFFRTRLSLTALYVAIIACIVCGFSVYLFTTIVHNLQITDAAYFTSPRSRQNFLEDVVEPIRYLFIGADFFIIALTIAFNYWFAGKTLRPIERALESQRLFAAKASHELRTPLTVIRNDSEVSLRSPRADVQELRATLESNIEEIGKMTDLIDHLLLIARSEQNGIPSETLFIGDVAADILRELSPMAKAQSISITLQGQGGAIRGEYQTIKRAISNIVRNSLEHTAAGGSVTVMIEPSLGAVRLSVADTGSGIASEDIPHVFERFYTGRIGRNKNGSGLGLAMVKEIVDQYGGSVRVKSEEGVGTTITMKLPNA